MRTDLTRKPLQTICKWRFQRNARRNHPQDSGPDLAAELEQKLNAKVSTQVSNGASIYRVPDCLRSMEPEAYEPNMVSIGPYHRGAARLQAMENTKWSFFDGVFNPSNPNHPNLNAVLNELKRIEPQARSCYSEDLKKIHSKQFIKMMLIDSCFILELLRQTFDSKSVPIQRWMIPVLQRDLIMLENQLPMFVLNKVYDLTSRPDEKEPETLKDLALNFFKPLIYNDSDASKNDDSLKVKGSPFLKFFRASICPAKVVKNASKDTCLEVEESHFLQLFRASICPTELVQNKFPEKEPHMFRSATDLRESGVKIKKAENCKPLDVSFSSKKGVLKIPPVSMDDHRFTLFRNMMAFEQCHLGCRPHVTAYVFFLDRLINSAKDVELLHYPGVLHHTLGGNKHAARLVNKLCKEVAGAADDSYLRLVLWKINCYCNDGWHQKRAKLKHEYFYNIWVTLSTMAAILIIYLTLLQTIWALGDQDARTHMSRTGFWASIAEAIVIPVLGPAPVPDEDNGWILTGLMTWIKKMHAKLFGGFKQSKNSPKLVKKMHAKLVGIFEWFFSYQKLDDSNPYFFMSC